MIWDVGHDGLTPRLKLYGKCRTVKRGRKRCQARGWVAVAPDSWGLCMKRTIFPSPPDFLHPAMWRSPGKLKSRGPAIASSPLSNPPANSCHPRHEFVRRLCSQISRLAYSMRKEKAAWGWRTLTAYCPYRVIAEEGTAGMPEGTSPNMVGQRQCGKWRQTIAASG